MHSYVALYRALGLATIRVAPNAKNPIGAEWQKRIDEPQDFLPNENVGVRLGAPSNGLVDVDLDCDEAVALAPRFLPSTATFGRATKPASHWLYRVPDPPKKASTKIGGVPLEMRSTGGQTVFPPSVHPSGETIEWTAADPTPASTDLPSLKAAFGRLTAATLIARADLQGQVHDAVLALAGALWHQGWSRDQAAELVLPALALRHGPDQGHREQVLNDTWGDHDRQRYGWPRVAELLGDVAQKALERAVDLVPPDDKPRGVPPTNGPLTDTGNAERFAQDHGADLRYCPPIGWLQWDGVRWSSQTDEPYPLAAQSARKLQAAGELKFGTASEDLRRLRATTTIAKTLPVMRVDLEQLDADPWLLNAPNGIIDLRTGELLPHNKTIFCTRTTGVPYDPTVPTPRFDRFVLELFDNDQALADYVLRFLGQALTGLPGDRCFQVWHGTGANGKSTFVDLLLDILGDYARTMSIGLLLDNGKPQNAGAASPQLAALRGVRFAASSETAEYQRWNESLLKQLTGRDKLTARFLYQKEEMEFPPTWTLVLATNHRPIVRGVDPAIWDRIHLVPFEVRFEGERVDRSLHDTLRAEAPGILALLVKHCIDWRAKGLCPPERVTSAVAEYRADQDTIGQFLEECCQQGLGLSCLRSALWAAYSAWADEANEYKLGRKTFNQRIAGRFDAQGQGSHTRWLGVSCSTPAAVVRRAIEKVRE